MVPLAPDSAGGRRKRSSGVGQLSAGVVGSGSMAQGNAFTIESHILDISAVMSKVLSWQLVF
ncbi:hypothetical protein D9M69_603480 [compost metagenome]